ncbi:L-ascorbate metabolism protein UlaG (beta-lactamase superfamily) [Streptomyces sp. TLI_235]|nr:MBL fold metallo-hydrolase [Streptomyces sp. TLI_235]PBC70573.1 L-ascorbate metabolism protein UlaG (beta-lactamase superfamily) [Streptomyces sp. TLI_235]
MHENPIARRSLLRTAAAGAAALPLAATAATAAAPQAAAAEAAPGTTGAPGTGAASHGDTVFRWLGTAGWRIESAGKNVLFDPYITRFDTGLFKPPFNSATPLTVDGDLVDHHAGTPDLILVSHGHWDHVNDVPHLAARSSAQVIGTATTCHLLRAMGVPASRLVVVKGGEVLEFGYCTVEVVASLHSRNAEHRYFAPGTLTAPPAAAPATIADLPEGDTLAFRIRFGDGPSAFLMGASDFVARNLAGLRPDVAMVAVQSSTATHTYVERLLTALDGPRTVVPVHWDNFETPLAEPAVRDPGADLDGFLARVRRHSPGTRLVVPEHLAPLRF